MERARIEYCPWNSKKPYHVVTRNLIIQCENREQAKFFLEADVDKIRFQIDGRIIEPLDANEPNR